MQEEENKRIENLKLKEWEERFDRNEKMKEQQQILKERRLRQRELDELNENENGAEINNELTSQLENFEVDKTSEN